MAARRFLFILALTVLANAIVIMRVFGWGHSSERIQAEAPLPLRSGDLVFRCSKGLVGDWFRRTSLTDRRFSHAGIFMQTKNGPVVAHLSQDPPAGLKIEPLGKFCFAGASSLIGWGQTDLADQARGRLVNVVNQELASGRPFDDRFSLDEDRAQYCTEWVREVFSTSTGDSAYFPVTQVDGFRYVAPDNLYINNHCTLIHTFVP